MASLSGWTEAIIGIIVFMVVLSFVITGFNYNYSRNYNSTFGIATTDAQKSLESYQDTLKTGTEGEATANAFTGISVLSSWDIIKTGISLVWQVLTGGWIVNAVSLLHLGRPGVYLGWGLRLLFIFSIGFILIKLLFKVKP